MTMSFPKRALRLALLLGVFGIPSPVSAETLRLEFCQGDDYTYEVYELRLEVAGSAAIKDGFDVDLTTGNGDFHVPLHMEPVEHGKGRRWWEGRSSLGFFLKETEIHPRIPGFLVSGPDSCQYQVVHPVDDPDRDLCAARYSFRVRQVKVGLRVDPPDAKVRLRKSASPSGASKGCAHARSQRPNPADDKLASAVQAALAADPALDPFLIEVGTRNGTVELSGIVSTLDVKRKAHMIAARTPGVRKVESGGLSPDHPYVGTSAIELGRSTIIIERIRGREVLFFASIDLPEDFLEKKRFFVSRDDLEQAVALRFSTTEDRQHGRNKALLEKALTGLNGIRSITIERTAE